MSFDAIKTQAQELYYQSVSFFSKKSAELQRDLPKLQEVASRVNLVVLGLASLGVASLVASPALTIVGVGAGFLGAEKITAVMDDLEKKWRYAIPETKVTACAVAALALIGTFQLSAPLAIGAAVGYILSVGKDTNPSGCPAVYVPTYVNL